MREEVKAFLTRAKEFFEDAKFDFKNKKYNLAAFHLEQAAQFLIKGKIA